MKIINKNRRGFSLVESLITLFIFSLVSTMVMEAYFTIFQARMKTRAVQQDVENARYAMEYMAKTLRMSSIFANVSNASNIELYDYSQKMCLKYTLDNSNHTLYVQQGAGHLHSPPNPDGKTWYDGCDGSSYGAKKPMTTASVDGLVFNGNASAYGASKKLGLVTISLNICYNDDCVNNAPTTIQSSVSLRDYSYINDGR